MKVIRIDREVVNSELKDFISSYWIFEFLPSSENDNKTDDVLYSIPPMGFPIMHIQYGDIQNFYQKKDLDYKSIIVGQITSHAFLAPRPGVKLFVVKFKPYGFYNLTGITPPNPEQRALSGSEVFGEDKVSKIVNNLSKALNYNEIIDNLENFLISIKNRNVKTHRFFDELVDEIFSKNGLVEINDILAGKLSTRTFQRYFNQVIGIGPKTYTKILRHMYIIKLFHENPNISWDNVLFSAYYFDFSHFNRDFKNFSTKKPSEYKAMDNSEAIDLIS